MTRIFLIRHGETEWNALGKLQGTSNVQLSTVGIHQARLLAAHAPFNTADAIYSSDLIRARSTAEILAQHFNLKVRIMLELRETNFGDWEGNSVKELAEDLNSGFENFFINPELCYPPKFRRAQKNYRGKRKQARYRRFARRGDSLAPVRDFEHADS